MWAQISYQISAVYVEIQAAMFSLLQLALLARLKTVCDIWFVQGLSKTEVHIKDIKWGKTHSYLWHCVLVALQIIIKNCN